MKTFKCKQCIYFSGVETKGHGECYGDCLLLETFKKFVDCYLPENSPCWCRYSDKISGMLDEESECILFKHNILKIEGDD